MEIVKHDQYIHHFSHPHLLELTNPQTHTETLTLIPPYCSACMLETSGSMYTCKTCTDFTLHVSCTRMPQSITHHPSHPFHRLSLLPRSIYPSGLFHCDGCGCQGDGFCYHCNDCEFDLHMLCAWKPLIIAHQSHPDHQLHLTFVPPYDQTIGFTCDICGHPGSNNQWLYRCSLCDFDAHLNCATNVNKASTTISQPQQPREQIHIHRYSSFPGANHGPVATGMNHNQFVHHSQSMGASPWAW